MDIKVLCAECHEGVEVKKPTRVKKTKPRQTAAASYAKMKRGVRPAIHPFHHFRSGMEANFARILNHTKVDWDYENKTFIFDKFGYRTKPFVYIMDFELLTATDGLPAGYYEIKGYMTPQSRQKLRRLKKCYPEDFKKTIVVIYNKYKKKDMEFCDKLGYRYLLFDELTKKYSPEIPSWE